MNGRTQTWEDYSPHPSPAIPDWEGNTQLPTERIRSLDSILLAEKPRDASLTFFLSLVPGASLDALTKHSITGDTATFPESFKQDAMIEPRLSVASHTTRNICSILESTGIYILHDETNIQSFLRSHPQLVDVLLEACDYLREFFGPDPLVRLELVAGSALENPKLYGYIFASAPVDEALDRLHKLDQVWFLDQSEQVDDLLNFNLVFK